MHKNFSIRSRFFLSFLIAALVGLALPNSFGLCLRAIIAWDSLAILYILSSFVIFIILNDSSVWLKNHASHEDESRWVILPLLSLAAFISLFAIGTLLKDMKSLSAHQVTVHLLIAGITVITSWVLNHLLFATHYAHGYYNGATVKSPKYIHGGLEFPGKEEPCFSDFLYYSFVVGMTCQVSDVQVTSRRMRRLTIIHGILSFFFNTIILAISVNVAASLIS